MSYIHFVLNLFSSFGWARLFLSVAVKSGSPEMQGCPSSTLAAPARSHTEPKFPVGTDANTRIQYTYAHMRMTRHHTGKHSALTQIQTVSTVSFCFLMWLVRMKVCQGEIYLRIYLCAMWFPPAAGLRPSANPVAFPRSQCPLLLTTEQMSFRRCSRTPASFTRIRTSTVDPSGKWPQTRTQGTCSLDPLFSSWLVSST